MSARRAEQKGIELVVLVVLEASAAVDGAVVPRLERDLGGCAAVCANCIVHFALGAPGVLPVGTARFAAYGLILEALLRVELLLAGCEHEFRSTILAYQCLVFEHV